MMSVKKNALICLIALSIIPTLATATPLTIINNTNHDSTSILNGGACSDILGPNGISRAHTTNVVPENVINKGCIFNKTNCRAEVHMTNNCSGPVVAIVTLDVKTGIKSVVSVDTSQGYVASGSGFTASISGGPAIMNWFKKIFGA